MQRRFNLDVGRALAITLVTGFHVWGFVGSPRQMVGAVDLFGYFASGFVGVDLFFVISGYSMMMMWENRQGLFTEKLLGFWRSRWLRIYPAYAVAVIFWTFVAHAGISSRSASAFDVATHLVFLHTLSATTFFSVSGVLWTLAVEAHFYILFPFIASLGTRLKITITVAALSYTIFISQLDWSSSPNEFIAKWNVIGFLPIFMLGVALYELKRTRALIAVGLVGLGAALVLMQFPDIVPLGHSSREAGLNMINRLLVGAGLGIFCIGTVPAHVTRSLAVRVITTLSFASYSIYLYNYIFVFVHSPIGGLVGILIYVPVVFAFGLIAWWLAERRFEAWRHARARSRRPSGA